jgi:tetratricopeptide (TPR) repeat protein
LDHLLLPLENLRQEVDFFACEESLRLLHVAVDPALHGPALDVLGAMQWSPDNRRAVFVLEDPADAKTERWNVWCDRIVAEYASVRAAYAKSGINLAEIGLPAEGESLIRFAVVVKAAAKILGKPPAATTGLTIIFSTVSLPEPDRWLAFLDEILNRTPSLGSVRWGWMETGSSIGTKFVSRLGKDNALHVSCRVDPARQQEELEDLLSSMTEAQDDAIGPAAVGAAGPEILSPAHPTDPPKPDATDAVPAKQANRLFLQALRAVRDGDMKEAVRLQNLAFQKCLSSRNLPLAVEMEMLLATYVVQAAGGEKASLRSALAIFQRASARAYEAGLNLSGAKIDLVLAPLAKLAGEFELAGQAVRRAADKARTPAPALGIEALRMGADFMLETGNPEKAAELLGEALEIATAMSPAEAKHTAGVQCAEALAAIFRDQKQDRRALEMADLAKRLSTGRP